MISIRAMIFWEGKEESRKNKSSLLTRKSVRHVSFSQPLIFPRPLAMIDASDTYIVRDVLTDDIIFITPEDALGGNNGYDVLYDNEVRIGLSQQQGEEGRRFFAVAS